MGFAIDLPPPGPVSPVTAECIQQAGARYRVPEALILAVLDTEGGWPGLARRNPNGTVDLGPMQVNSQWLRTLRVDVRDLRDHGCFNLFVGTAILAAEIRAAGKLGTGVGNYHSRKAIHHNRYLQAVTRSLRSILTIAQRHDRLQAEGGK